VRINKSESGNVDAAVSKTADVEFVDRLHKVRDGGSVKEQEI